MARTKSTAAIKAAASTLETALKSLAISSSASDTHGVSIDTPTSSASSQVARIASYFDCFAGFEANNAAPIRDEFNRLATHQKWSKKSETYKEQRLICLTMEFDRCYGHLTSTNLEAWQGLCSEIMPDASIPTSINQCKKVCFILQVLKGRKLTSSIAALQGLRQHLRLH